LVIVILLKKVIDNDNITDDETILNIERKIRRF